MLYLIKHLKNLILLSLLILPACTIYQSPERRTFESESPTFKVQSLQKMSCSQQSVKPQSSQSRMLTFNDDISIWEHIINNKSVFESDDLNQKEYCLYANKNKH